MEGSGNDDAGSDGNRRELAADVGGGWGWGSRTGLKTNGLQAESLMNQIMQNNSVGEPCMRHRHSNHEASAAFDVT